MQNDWFSSDLYMHIPELDVSTLHYPLMSSYSPYYWSHSCFQTASIVLILWLLKMLYIINIFTLLTNMYVCICSYVHVTVYIWRSESSLWKCLLFFPPCESNIKFKWSGLAHGAILVLEGFIVFLHWRDEFTFLLRLYKGSQSPTKNWLDVILIIGNLIGVMSLNIQVWFAFPWLLQIFIIWQLYVSIAPFSSKFV